MANFQASRILTIPLEIRELIFDILFLPSETIKVTAGAAREYEYNPTTETDSTTWPADFESWDIAPSPRSSQILRVCRQLHTEAIPFLYSQRCFDVTARESLKLLLHNITPSCFVHIRTILLDWDALQTFAWDLKKDEYQTGMSGLRGVQLATWRIRHMQGTSVRWRNVKGYERMQLQAAYDITSSHTRLKLLVEEPFKRKGSVVGLDQRPVSNCRVKWRFIAIEEELKEGEHLVDVKADLESLKATQEEADEGGFSLPMIDPF